MATAASKRDCRPLSLRSGFPVEKELREYSDRALIERVLEGCRRDFAAGARLEGRSASSKMSRRGLQNALFRVNISNYEDAGRRADVAGACSGDAQGADGARRTPAPSAEYQDCLEELRRVVRSQRPITVNFIDDADSDSTFKSDFNSTESDNNYESMIASSCGSFGSYAVSSNEWDGHTVVTPRMITPDIATQSGISTTPEMTTQIGISTIPEVTTLSGKTRCPAYINEEVGKRHNGQFHIQDREELRKTADSSRRKEQECINRQQWTQKKQEEIQLRKLLAKRKKVYSEQQRDERKQLVEIKYREWLKKKDEEIRMRIEREEEALNKQKRKKEEKRRLEEENFQRWLALKQKGNRKKQNDKNETEIKKQETRKKKEEAERRKEQIILENRIAWEKRKAEEQVKQRRQIEAHEKQKKAEEKRNKERVRAHEQYVKKMEERAAKDFLDAAQRRAQKERERAKMEERRRALNDRAFASWIQRAASRPLPQTGSIFTKTGSVRGNKAAIGYINPKEWVY